MSMIVTCTCGAKVRLPEGDQPRKMLCPKCRNSLAMTSDALVLNTITVNESEKVVCPVCQSQVASEEACVKCPDCEILHHKECWSEMGGCSTYGCKQAPNTEKTESSYAREGHWGDNKVCPVCKETIKAIALRCRYCKTDFDSVDPMTMKDIKKAKRKKLKIKDFQNNVIVIFVLSLIPCISPIMLLANLAFMNFNREFIAKSEPIYKIISWVSLIISIVFSALILLFGIMGAFS